MNTFADLRVSVERKGDRYIVDVNGMVHGVQGNLSRAELSDLGNYLVREAEKPTQKEH